MQLGFGSGGSTLLKTVLSILYLRCWQDRGGAGQVDVVSFNSLFEMPAWPAA